MDPLATFAKLQGFRVIEDPNMTTAKEVEKTLIERFFYFPWKPWRKIKIIQAPQQDFIMMNNPYLGGDILIMHPVTAEKFRNAIKTIEGQGKE